MASGGKRNRSGRRPDPGSARSASRDFGYVALPSEGYQGEVPEFPKPVQHDRVVDLWNEAWATPQAAVWAAEPWRWPIIAEYCNIAFLVEAEASAALIGQLHRYRDQLGLTPAGLVENGWELAADEMAEKRSEKRSAEPSSDRPLSARERRLAAVADAQ